MVDFPFLDRPRGFAAKECFNFVWKGTNSIPSK